MALTKVTRNLLSTGIDDQSTSTAITIDSSGNVGIGKSSPFQKVDVVGNIRAANSGADTKVEMAAPSDSYSPYIAWNVVGIRNSGALGYPTGSGDLVYRSGGYTMATGTETVRFQQSGGISFNGDTAAANALDDYEEGTWTPTLIGSSSNPTVTYTYQYGTYTKIGNVVHCNAAIRTSDYTGGSGDLRISGLPFTSGGGTAENVGSCMFYRVASLYETVVYVQPSDTYCFFLGRNTLTTSGTWGTIQTTDWTAANPTIAIFSVTYFV